MAIHQPVVREVPAPVRRTLSGIVLCALGACAGDPEIDRDMELACVTVACECVTPSFSPFDRKPPEAVLWRDNGNAYCPEGQVLRRANYKGDFIKKRGG